MNKTEHIKAGDYILNDLQKNALINNKSKDYNFGDIYNFKYTDNTLSTNLNIPTSVYYDRYKLSFKNKELDQTFVAPIYDYETNGGREPQYFTSVNQKNYSTPPLETIKGRY